MIEKWEVKKKMKKGVAGKEGITLKGISTGSLFGMYRENEYKNV